MNIEDKIAECADKTRKAMNPLNIEHMVWNPDTLYVGEHEYLEMLNASTSPHANYPIKHFMGLRVIRVRLETYLQLAGYV